MSGPPTPTGRKASAAKIARVKAAIAANEERKKIEETFYKGMTPERVRELLHDSDTRSSPEKGVILRYASNAAKEAGVTGIHGWGLDLRDRKLVIWHHKEVEVKGLPDWIDALVVFQQDIF